MRASATSASISAERGTHQTGNAWRPVDDDVIGIARQLRRFPVQGIARQADDAEQPPPVLTRPLLRPIQRRTLRIGVDEGHALAPPGPFTGEMQRQRRLADAALLIEERDDHGVRLPAAPAPRPRFPRANKEELDSLLAGVLTCVPSPAARLLR
jgi:hypothetical protein